MNPVTIHSDIETRIERLEFSCHDTAECHYSQRWDALYTTSKELKLVMRTLTKEISSSPEQRLSTKKTRLKKD